MLRITEKSEKMGISEKGTSKKLRELLEKYNLVFDDFMFDKEKARDIILLDKKSSSDTISYIMLKKIGDCIIKEIPKQDAFITEE